MTGTFVWAAKLRGVVEVTLETEFREVMDASRATELVRDAGSSRMAETGMDAAIGTTSLTPEADADVEITAAVGRMGWVVITGSVWNGTVGFPEGVGAGANVGAGEVPPPNQSTDSRAPVTLRSSSLARRR
ncbi:MAG: hypothetical protein Q4C47_02525 [Planctomycetia bacterium]|nr:hypothetical protein [Planctomycetia bacterium]